MRVLFNKGVKETIERRTKIKDLTDTKLYVKGKEKILYRGEIMNLCWLLMIASTSNKEAWVE